MPPWPDHDAPGRQSARSPGAPTTGDVLAIPDLRLDLLTGGDGLGRDVRWAHVIELADPVPWLRGGELVLTVELGLPDDEAGQRAYVWRLAEAGSAGLVFPPGEVRAELPPEVLAPPPAWRSR